MRHKPFAPIGGWDDDLWRQTGDQPGRELQDDGSIDARRVAVSVNVGGLLTEQERDDSGSELQDQGGIYAADVVVAVDVSQKLCT